MGPVGIAVAVVTAAAAYSKGADARSNAHAAQAVADANAARAREAASVQKWLDNYKRYQEEFKDAYKPWLVTEQDRAALAEQDLQHAFGADVGRRNMSGSGLALFGKSSIRSGRQAQIAGNLSKYKQAWEGAARDEADKTRTAQINAVVGMPQRHVPTMSGATVALGAAQQGIAAGASQGALSGYGQGGWQSWFKKDSPTTQTPTPSNYWDPGYYITKPKTEAPSTNNSWDPGYYIRR